MIGIGYGPPMCMTPGGGWKAVYTEQSGVIIRRPIVCFGLVFKNKVDLMTGKVLQTYGQEIVGYAVHNLRATIEVVSDESFFTGFLGYEPPGETHDWSTRAKEWREGQRAQA